MTSEWTYTRHQTKGNERSTRSTIKISHAAAGEYLKKRLKETIAAKLFKSKHALMLCSLIQTHPSALLLTIYNKCSTTVQMLYRKI